jgi:hypothetical protein
VKYLLRPLAPALRSRFLDRRFPDLPRIASLWVYRAICQSYIPRPYSGALALLQPEKDICRSADPSLGWKDVAGNVEVYPIPGWHSTAIATYPDRVAAVIGAKIDRRAHQDTRLCGRATNGRLAN